MILAEPARAAVGRSARRSRGGPLRLALLIVAAACALHAPAQTLAERTDEALDRVVAQITYESMPIRDALTRLGAATGLRFEIDDSVLALMPYGAKTRIGITIRQMSVRRALHDLLGGLGLQMEPRGPVIAIVPSPVLQRLGRKLTLEEARVLERLAQSSWDEIRQKGDIPLELRIDPALNPAERLAQALRQAPAASALRQLEAATQALGWSWTPDGNRIVFMTRVDANRLRLERPVDAEYRRVTLDYLLIDLGRRAGVTVLFEPGVLTRIDAERRKVDLGQQGISIRQTLERICGATGLRYTIEADGIRISGPSDGGAAPQPSGRGRVLAVVRLPPDAKGNTIEFPIYEEDLPEDIRASRQDRLQAAIARLREYLQQNP